VSSRRNWFINIGNTYNEIIDYETMKMEDIDVRKLIDIRYKNKRFPANGI